MNREIKLFPLKFEQAFEYVTDQLRDGNSLARELLTHLDLKQGSFFALLQPLADITKIYEFRAGGILPANLLEAIPFQGELYSGRKKSHSVRELALYLKSILSPKQCCFFEDLVHQGSDSVEPDLRKYVLYLHKEVYLYIKEEEFSHEMAERTIQYVDAQWYYMNVISETGLKFEINMNSEQLQNIALNATLIVIGAYDMEGFVVWKKFSGLQWLC